MQTFWRDFHTFTTEERTAHEAKYGGYNDFPPNWRRLTEKQFAQGGFFTFSPVLVEYRQMLNHVTTRERKPLRDQAAMSAKLFYMHDNTGYAITNDYWAGYVRFYAFGCRGVHQNHTTCPECGFAANYDSSD